MNNHKEYFYLPFASLLIYTFGAFFLFNMIVDKVFLSPGSAPLGGATTTSVTISIMAVVIVLLFISARKNKGEKNEQ